mmetsp:Transcript_3541/g.8455  ORF Transcript_3541/g.8455 Transcript_3541/m.8455 type:complete len:386 (-) Transcript_3541:1809-2966(-)
MSSDGNPKNDTSMENNSSMVSGAVDNENEDLSTMYGIPQSPGSLLGSSIRSNQVESFDIESESCSVTGENSGWKLGMPWLSNNQNKNSKAINQKNQELHRYYGGIMKASGESPTGQASPSPTSITSSSSRHFLPFRKNNKRQTPPKTGKPKDKPKSLQKPSKTKRTINEKDSLSIPIARTKSSTGDSIADFDDSEWTPPDSSYGAACPVCGCIPKRVRQMIEMTLITAMVFGLIYLVVKASMIIAESHRGHDVSTGNAADSYFNGGSYNRTGTSSASSTNVVTDDDVYVEKYNNYNDDGNVDDATAADDNYNDDSSGDDQYGGDDNANSGSGYYRNKNQNYYNYGYPNRYYNNNYKYNGYNNDDANGGRRQLRSSMRSSQRRENR